MKPCRRNHQRYRVRDKTYAAVTPEYHVLGPVGDISRGGLCFTYTDTRRKEKKPPYYNDREGGEKILLSSVNHCIGKIPFETVADYELTPASFFSMPVRKRHIKFGKLAPRQQSEIDSFLEHAVNSSVTADSTAMIL